LTRLGNLLNLCQELGIRTQQVGGPNSAVNDDDGAARLCRQFAGGDPAAFIDCMDEYEDNGGWMPDDNLPA